MNKINQEIYDRYQSFLENKVKEVGTKFSKNTFINYMSDVRQFLDFIGDMYCVDADSEDVTRWLNSLKGRNGSSISSSTRNRKKISVVSLYDFIVLNPKYNIEKNAMKLLTIEKIDNSVKRDYLDTEELKRFKKVVFDEVKNPSVKNMPREKAINFAIKYKAIIMTLLETGMRIEELNTLQMNQIVLYKDGNPCFYIPPEKNKNNKVKKFIPISNMLVEYIKDYHSTLDHEVGLNDYVFISKNGNKLNGGDINEKLKQYTKKAGIDKIITNHSLRHTMASQELIHNTTSLPVLAKQLGHNPDILYKTYFHNDTADVTNYLFK